MLCRLSVAVSYPICPLSLYHKRSVTHLEVYVSCCVQVNVIKDNIFPRQTQARDNELVFYSITLSLVVHLFVVLLFGTGIQLGSSPPSSVPYFDLSKEDDEADPVVRSTHSRLDASQQEIDDDCEGELDMEDVMDDLRIVVDGMCLMDLEELNECADRPRDNINPEAMVALVNDNFASATKGSESNKKRAWLIYQKFYLQTVLRQPLSASNLADDSLVVCPPSSDDWVRFLVHARTITSSFRATTNLVKLVSAVGHIRNRNAAKKCGLVYSGPSVIMLYKTEHARVMQTLCRGTCKGVRSVLGVTMEEALSYPRFIDQSSCRGLMDGALFGYGCLSIKRARSLTSLLLKHVTIRAVQVYVTGSSSPTMVPEMIFDSHDEKFGDTQGVRQVYDSLSGTRDYDVKGVLGPAYWLYKLFVMRGVLEGVDPLLSACHGDVLPFIDSARHQYVFCAIDSVGDVMCGFQPQSVQIFSDSTRRVLHSMGSPERGFSAHRKGGATRAIILALLRSKGKEISSALENVMLRWGGWSQKTGIITLRTIYQQKIMDLFVDRYALSFGIELPDHIWDQRLKDYQSTLVLPEGHDNILSPRCAYPRAMIMHSLSEPVFSAAKLAYDQAMFQLMIKCRAEQPIDRYMEQRKCFAMALKDPRHSELVNHLSFCRGRVQHAWKIALNKSYNHAEGLVFSHAVDQGIPLCIVTQRLVLRSIALVGFGNYDTSCLGSSFRWKTDGMRIDPIRFQNACYSGRDVF